MERYCYSCMKPIPDGAVVCPICGNPTGGAGQPEFALPCGTLLHAGKYRIGRVLGQGGFGITYVGLDLTLEMKVAIKEYYPVNMASRSGSGTSLQWHSSVVKRNIGRESFVREAQKMAKTHSIPNVVDVRDVFYENETAYIVMDFLEGETLRDRLMRTGPMTVADCVKTLSPVMEALQKAHERGLIHRDVSPDNIMLDPEGTVWLLDLGAAKDLGQGQNAGPQSTTPVMKRGFSPPEQYTSSGLIGPWTDVYAVCATIYYCVTGRLLPEAMDRMLGASYALPQDLPKSIADALRHGLELNAEQRTQSMAALLAELNVAPGPRKLPMFVKIAAPVLLVAVILAAVLAGGGRSKLDREAAAYVLETKDVSTPTPGPKLEPKPALELELEQPAQELELKYEVLGDHVEITGCYGEVTDLVIPSKIEEKPVTVIGVNAFYRCTTLSAVTIPDSVTKIESAAFGACASLTGVTIPNRVTEIEFATFLDCSSLTEVTIPDGITKIGVQAFDGCKKLTKVTIPASVSWIGESAFAECTALKDVEYLGSKAQWSTIDVKEGNHFLTGATIHCSVPDPEPDEEPTSISTPNDPFGISSLKVGDIFSFGSYEQDNYTSNGRETIEWLVLDRENDRLLVISKHALEMRQYHNQLVPVTWATSELRSWLNNEFLNSAFTLEEQSVILKTTIRSEANPYYSVDPGPNTDDWIFILSPGEALSYFQSDASRICTATAYAKSHGKVYVNPETSGSWWWLRTPASKTSRACSVNSDGTIDYQDGNVNAVAGTVRPAMWISLEDVANT